MSYETVIPEWKRVLRKNGRVLIVWTPWYNPYAHHLENLVPIPWAHVLFSEKTLIETCEQIYDMPEWTPPVWDIDANGNKMAGDEDIFRSINDGLHATSMPAWGGFYNKQQIGQLVAYIKTFASVFKDDKSGAALDFSGEIPSSPASIAKGKEHFEKTFECHTCHGIAGRGNGHVADGYSLHVEQPGVDSIVREQCLVRSVRRRGQRRSNIAATGAEICGIKKLRSGRVKRRQVRIAAVHAISASGERTDEVSETCGSGIAGLVSVAGNREVRVDSLAGEPHISIPVDSDGAWCGRLADSQWNCIDQLTSIRTQLRYINRCGILGRLSGTGKCPRRRREVPGCTASNVSRTLVVHLNSCATVREASKKR
jgi:mono/diheme cytochrome c family protein